MKALIKLLHNDLETAKATLVEHCTKDEEFKPETLKCHFSDIQPLPFSLDMVQ